MKRCENNALKCLVNSENGMYSSEVWQLIHYTLHLTCLKSSVSPTLHELSHLFRIGTQISEDLLHNHSLPEHAWITLVSYIGYYWDYFRHLEVMELTCIKWELDSNMSYSGWLRLLLLCVQGATSVTLGSCRDHWIHANLATIPYHCVKYYVITLLNY